MTAAQIARRAACGLAALALAVGISLVPANASSGSLPVPEGWALSGARPLGVGAEIFTLSRVEGPVVANVVRAAPDRLALRAVVSHDRISGPTAGGERISSMCARLGCIAAVNADFARLGTDQPVGAVVSGGRILRSPVGTHHQFSVGFGPLMASGLLEWRGRLVTSELEELPIEGLNDRNLTEGAVLFTPSWGPTVPTGPDHLNLVLRFLNGPGELAPAATTAMEMVRLVGGGEVTIAPGTAVLSAVGPDRDRLQHLWDRSGQGGAARRALLRIDLGPDARESVGGTPVLVREGRAWVQGDGTGFVSGRHPRTAVGWDAQGRVLLVTVDGRQPGHSVGLSLPDLAELMLGIGAVDGLNLDGGGSTTMVVANQIVNRPSDRLVRRGGAERLVPVVVPGDEVLGNIERPVSVGLLLVPEVQIDEPAADLVAPAPADVLTLPGARELQLALPAGDPGSDPMAGGLPLLLAAEAPAGAPTGRVWTWLVLALALQVAVTGLVFAHGKRLAPAPLPSRPWPIGSAKRT